MDSSQLILLTSIYHPSLCLYSSSIEPFMIQMTMFWICTEQLNLNKKLDVETRLDQFTRLQLKFEICLLQKASSWLFKFKSLSSTLDFCLKRSFFSVSGRTTSKRKSSNIAKISSKIVKVQTETNNSINLLINENLIPHVFKSISGKLYQVT